MSTEPGWIEPEEIGLQLILRPPVAPDPALLADLLAAAPVAALLLADAAAVRACREVCAAAGAAVLLVGDPADVRAAGADGVHLDRYQDVAAARRLLGTSRLIGCDCGMSRHAAMVAGEEGADYVMFGAADRHLAGPADPAMQRLLELATWWGELFVLPLALAGEVTAAEVPALRRVTDFLMPGPGLWADPGTTRAALAAFGRAIAAKDEE